jgi:hypothetical protein
MKSILSITALLLALASSSNAKSIQSNTCLAATSCSFNKNPPTQGDLLIAVADNRSAWPVISSTGNETWTRVILGDWYGGAVPLWYAIAAGGAETISLSLASNLIIAQYPPATLDAIGKQTHDCCNGPKLSAGPVTTTSVSDLIVTWVGFSGGGGVSTATAGNTDIFVWNCSN